ncbi:metallophosphoesterase [Thermincola ferriacetica]|uniref:Metallophosphoesterase n=1 Tax=Thermincola ferriacetica TaxID=281456 RepID=A0A0L6W1U0_9FIRM|nr:metallophosphoesterase [Thermincola ferriacetica]KNZ69368.1 metallophosphoesterase [Thermincola ferriacetica]
MKRFLAFLLVSFAIIVGAAFALYAFGNTEFRIAALQAQLKLDLTKPGVTEIQVPPLGKIKAYTHKSPVGIVITLESIDLNQLKKMVEDTPKTTELLNEVRRNVEKNFQALIYKSLLLGGCGGLLGVLLLQRKKWYEYLYGALLGLVIVTLALSFTYKSYNFQAFENPEYEGMLKTAPWMIGLVQNGITKFDLWSKQLQTVADNLYDMFRRVDTLEAMGPAANGDLRVLHVSDLHNNPAAFDFIEQVATTFKVDLVIDTGDISDFGTPVETVLLDRLKRMGIPYVFVPGNHETREVINELRGLPNVTVLEGQPVNVKGLKIIGFPDPSAYEQSITAPDDKTAGLLAQKFTKSLTKMPEKPDILAVHNNRIALRMAGKVPVILHGHDHAYKINIRNKSVIIDAGTTGAAGIGGFKSKNDIPYSLVVLQLKKELSDYHLIAADTIKVSNLQSGYSLERRIFPEIYQQVKKE